MCFLTSPFHNLQELHGQDQPNQRVCHNCKILKISRLLFADDLVLLPSSEPGLQRTLNGLLMQVEKFKDLVVAFTSDERQDEKLDVWSGKASAVMRALHHSVVLKR